MIELVKHHRMEQWRFRSQYESSQRNRISLQ